MQTTNFKIFALDYLTQWYEVDRRFVSGLERDNDKATRLATLQAAAVNYNVNRNFPVLDGEVRLEGALAALDDTHRPESDTAVNSAVHKLANELKLRYGHHGKVSAASKFLWFRYKSPVVIYDSRARACLRQGTSDCDEYEVFLKQWRQRFTENADAIGKACLELIRVRDFLADAVSDDEFIGTTSSQWFHERVFDKYLWWNGQREKKSLTENTN